MLLDSVCLLTVFQLDTLSFVCIMNSDVTVVKTHAALCMIYNLYTMANCQGCREESFQGL